MVYKVYISYWIQSGLALTASLMLKLYTSWLFLLF